MKRLPLTTSRSLPSYRSGKRVLKQTVKAPVITHLIRSTIVITTTFQRTDGSDVSNISGAYSNIDGTYFWAAEDTDDNGGDGLITKTITFNAVDISGQTDLIFSGLFGAGNENDPGSNGYDRSDEFKVTYSIDGGAFQNGVWFSYENHGDDFNEPIGLDANFDGEADENGVNRLGTALQEFSFPLPTGNNVVIKITVAFGSGNEEVAFDNFRIVQGEPEENLLSISKSAEPNIDLEPNDLVTYTIVVSSTGGEETVAITDTLPSEVDFAYWIVMPYGASINNDVLTANEIVSSTQPVTISFAVTNTAGAGSVTNLAEYVGEFGEGSAEAEYTIKPVLIINEISADPDSTDGDANGDGEAQFSDDEFIEIVNISDAPVDLSGWVMADGAQDRHTFPAGSVIPAGCALVLFGGGTPTGTFGNALVQTASEGSIGLNQQRRHDHAQRRLH